MTLSDALASPPARHVRRGVIDTLLDQLDPTEAQALRTMLGDPYRWPAQTVVDALAKHCDTATSTTAVREWRRRNP